MNETYRLLIYAADDDLLGKYLHTVL